MPGACFNPPTELSNLCGRQCCLMMAIFFFSVGKWIFLNALFFSDLPPALVGKLALNRSAARAPLSRACPVGRWILISSLGLYLHELLAEF